MRKGRARGEMPSDEERVEIEQGDDGSDGLMRSMWARPASGVKSKTKQRQDGLAKRSLRA
jgi:hypothetical protein